jgi:16S rRNA (guanine966-N2)-methyltransferase
MRIIAGEHRGRRLLAPVGDQTRPVTDRAKQSIFDVLAPRIDGAIVYDCFAGTGSFGLESLSRGARHVTFFESHRSTLALLRRNLAAIGAEKRATIITADWFAYIKAPANAERADLIFLDPPYRYLRERAADLQAAAQSLALRHCAPDGLVVFRHDAADALSLPAFAVADARRYGDMAVEFLTPLPPNP